MNRSDQLKEYYPLHDACVKGYAKTVMGLLQLGADVNLKDATGRTPLHLAAEYTDNPELIEILLKYDADMHAKVDIWTPINLAQIHKHQKVVATLEKYESLE